MGRTGFGVVLTCLLVVVVMLKGEGVTESFYHLKGERERGALHFDTRNVKSTFIWSMWDMDRIT